VCGNGVGQDERVTVERGQSAVVVPVPEVEPVVSSWRERFDRSAAQGMPAHITVLYPFLTKRLLTSGVLCDLRAICGEHHAFRVAFERTARFPNVLYLNPEPAEPLRTLTLALAERWPQALPYSGTHDEIVPHLTIAYGEDAVLDAVDLDLQRRLPLAAMLKEAILYVFDGARWQVMVRLPLKGSRGNW
jgi:2'-5' RNA ligase